MPRMLMTVIRYCINTENHELKKLLMLFWEIVPKYDSNRKLLPEMILVRSRVVFRMQQMTATETGLQRSAQ